MIECQINRPPMRHPPQRIHQKHIIMPPPREQDIPHSRPRLARHQPHRPLLLPLARQIRPRIHPQPPLQPRAHSLRQRRQKPLPRPPRPIPRSHRRRIANRPRPPIPRPPASTIISQRPQYPQRIPAHPTTFAHNRRALSRIRPPVRIGGTAGYHAANENGNRRQNRNHADGKNPSEIKQLCYLYPSKSPLKSFLATFLQKSSISRTLGNRRNHDANR